MIVIVSSITREASALATLCENRNWPCQPCSTVDRFMSLNEQLQPRALVIRHQLQDGYSDDALNFLRTTAAAVRPRVIVLMAADSTGKAEARQIELGADCVLRDPVRIEVLLEYLGKYRTASVDHHAGSLPSRVSYEFAGVDVFPHEHQISLGEKTIHVAPQEIALIRMLVRSSGKVVTYSNLYDELLNRKFGGDTTNCRVLLGKVSTSFKQLGVDLKRYVQVIPKSGYLYVAATNQPPTLEPVGQRATKSRRSSRQPHPQRIRQSSV